MERPTIRAIVPNERKERMLRKGDLLLEKSGGGDLQPVGAVVMYDHEVPAVCSNFVARMPITQYFSPSYLTYLHSCLYARRLNVRSIKQTTGIQNLDSHSYLSERVAFPPLPEQTAIVRFLDHADRRIQRYIRAKQKLIALLEEQKQAIIYQAVTGQIDVRTGQRYPAYKPSGVEWLEEVPEHWEMVRNGRLFVQRNEIGFPELPILEVSLKTGVRIRDFENSDRKQVMSDRSMYKRAAKGDIAYNMMRMWQGAVGAYSSRWLGQPSICYCQAVARELIHGTTVLFFAPVGTWVRLTNSHAV